MPLQITPGSIVGDHVLLTGPISGSVQTADGRTVDVGPAVIAVSSQEEADEISFLIGERHRVEGHPDDFDRDENGQLVQRPFEHDVPAEFADRVSDEPTAGTPAEAAGDSSTSKKKG